MKKWLSLTISMMMVMTLMIPVNASDNELPIIGDHQDETSNETNSHSSSDQKSTSSVNKETNNVKDTSTTENSSAVAAVQAVKTTPGRVIMKVTKQKTKKTVYTCQKVSIKVKGAKGFKSSDRKIAIVSKKGVLKIKKAGTVKITFKKKGKKYTVTLKIKKPVLKLSASKVSIKVKKTYMLKVKKVTPVNPVKFSAKNKKIASVSSKGVITGKKKGTTYVYVQVNGMKKSIKVTVK